MKKKIFLMIIYFVYLNKEIIKTLIKNKNIKNLNNILKNKY